MNKLRLVIFGLAFLMASCTALHPRSKPERPTIKVSGGKVERVVPEPLEFQAKQGAVVIQWDAPAGFRFAGQGIVIDGELDRIGGRIIDKDPSEVGRCTVTGNRLQVQCVNARTRKGIYKYTVLLQQADGKALPPFDPHIVNKD